MQHVPTVSESIIQDDNNSRIERKDVRQVLLKLDLNQSVDTSLRTPCIKTHRNRTFELLISLDLRTRIELLDYTKDA